MIIYFYWWERKDAKEDSESKDPLTSFFCDLGTAEGDGLYVPDYKNKQSWPKTCFIEFPIEFPVPNPLKMMGHYDEIRWNVTQ